MRALIESDSRRMEECEVRDARSAIFYRQPHASPDHPRVSELISQRRCWIGRVLRAPLLAIAIVWPLFGFSANAPGGVTVDDVLGRTLIRSFSLSPDGNHVAFLTTQALCRQDVYRVRLQLRGTSALSKPVELSEILLPPAEVFDNQSHFRLRTVAQYVWSANSRRLLYTVHVAAGMELRVFNLDSGATETILAGHQHIEIDDVLPHQTLTIRTFDARRERQTREFPEDRALLMRDSYRFDLPLPNPRTAAPVVTESWRFSWHTERTRRIPKTRTVRYWPYPDEYSWNGHSVDIRYYGPLPDENPGTVDQSASANSNVAGLQVEMDYKPTGTTVHTRQGVVSREVYSDNGLLIAHYSEKTDQTRQTYVSRDGRTAVLLRSTNLVPDQLVLLDLLKSKMTPLFSPNEAFRDKTRGITVRVMPVPVADGKMSGRLFLPANYDSRQRYPLVFTTYLSTAGFNLGSGEVPILPLLSHGIAVFALDARDVNEPGERGDFASELRRLQTPLQAMRWIVDRLSQEGIIDPKRIAVSGLSYGTEISMYAYWNSDLFRTVSATTGSWEPMLYAMGGLGWEGSLKDRGFSDPKESLAKWQELSAGLNARATLPPLLWQAPDAERQWCVESWFELRRAGAQVEWLEYPDEGHVKRSPANQWWVHERNLDWFRFWLKDEEDRDQRKDQQYTRWRQMRTNWYAATAGAQNGATSLPLRNSSQ